MLSRLSNSLHGSFSASHDDQVLDYTDSHRVACPYRKNGQAFIKRFDHTVRHERLDCVHHSMAFELMRPPLHSLSHLT